MKKLLSSLPVVLFLLSPFHAAAVPGTVSFSARIQDNGRPLTGNHAFVFRFYDGPDAGTAALLWEETKPSVPVSDGVVATALGDTVAIDPSVVFNGLPVYLQVTLDGTVFPLVAIQTVPYAFRAAVADSVPFSGVTGKVGNLVSTFNANRNAVPNTTGFAAMTTHTPTVNVNAFVIARCAFDGSAAGQLLAFRAAIRSPPGTGTVVSGGAFEAADDTPGANLWVSNSAVDTFALNAGQAYELGMNFLTTPTGGANNDFCALHVQTFQR